MAVDSIKYYFCKKEDIELISVNHYVGQIID